MMATSIDSRKLFSVIFVISVVILVTLNNVADANKRNKDVNALSLGERVQQLTDFSNKRPVIRMNVQKFNDLVKGTPRNYSVIVMFTALSPARGCAICGPANDEFSIVANSFRFNSQIYSNKLFFALVDFDECGSIFQSLKLYTAPVFIHFPAKGKPLSQDKMDIQRFGVEAEAIARWIAERTDIQIRVFRPPNYSGTMALIIVSVLVGGLLYLKRNNLEFLYNKTAWGIASLFIVFCFTSGQMWNQIRGPPVVQRTQNGISYIHRSSQGQLVIETYIVFLLSSAITIGMILLIEAGKGKGDIRKRRVMLVVGLGMFALFFGMILSIFKSKAHGYPYSFIMS
ncbi:Magnesium transporter protein 1 [Orchesella cincta]|uniref:Magnesium transporter protein 1 n=1 Tax=Orchesella cincta TaxID=48709 RepID=A0A1D2MST3_ORCCI|nr:Magnesium transporter protein 1 [Orchesella cincta]